MALPGMETGYFFELCTKWCQGTIHVRGEPFLEPKQPRDLDSAAWGAAVLGRECGKRECAARAIQGSCPAKI